MAWVLGFVVPTLMLFVGLLGKKIVSGRVLSRFVDAEDLFLGLEFTLAALVASILNLCDLYRLELRASDAREKAVTHLDTLREEELKAGHADRAKIMDIGAEKEKSRLQAEILDDNRSERGRTILCLVFSFVCFLIVAILHRNWAQRRASGVALTADETRTEKLHLGVGTVLGYLSMVMYMLHVKGVY